MFLRNGIGPVPFEVDGRLDPDQFRAGLRIDVDPVDDHRKIDRHPTRGPRVTLARSPTHPGRDADRTFRRHQVDIRCWATARIGATGSPDRMANGYATARTTVSDKAGTRHQTPTKIIDRRP